MPPSQKAAVLLAQKSANRCAKPDCNELLSEPGSAFDPEITIGQAAHIVAESDTGPRADPDMPLKERNSEPNLVLLCLKHHRIADAQENTYSVEEMREWKRRHEAAVESKMDEYSTAITFIELELAADAIATDQSAMNSGFSLVDVRTKMVRNGLSDAVLKSMNMGMLSADVVREFIAQRSTTDPDFPSRLTHGFTDEYARQHARGLRGDELFFAMQSFASPPSLPLDRQVAGIAVLVHLFRICEVFEHDPS